MEQEENLDLLDLDTENEIDALPEAAPFTNPRPKKPWLLMGLGFAVIVLATWIIVAKIGGDSGTSVNIDLDAPVVTVDDAATPEADLKVPEKTVDVAPVEKPVEKTAPKPVESKPAENEGMPVRVINDRQEVTFNPDKPSVKPAAKPATKAAPKPVAKNNTKTASVSNNAAPASAGNIYVQFGSYSTRALAQSAEQKIRASHGSLFSGKQFVILAANVKGQTIYRLRVAFHNASDANGFCRNAKSDGLDCYVTK